MSQWRGRGRHRISGGKGKILKTKNVYIIAGSNGSGKTTFARLFLPNYANCPNFINADLIAQGLAPFNPNSAAIKSGKIVIQQIHEFSDRGVDFAFETTLSGKSYMNLFKTLKNKGYTLHLFYLWIPSPKLAISRIKERVSEGGHNINDEDVRRRFSRSIHNFLTLYQSLFDYWMLFDNSKTNPILIAKNNKGQIEIIDSKVYQMIKEI